MMITRSTKRELEDFLMTWSGPGCDKTHLTILRCTLEMLVPMYAEYLRDFSGDYLKELGRESLLRIATNGPEDLVIAGPAFIGSNRSDTVNALARMIAICSLVPGGINCFGIHFEAGPEQAVEAKD